MVTLLSMVFMYKILRIIFFYFRNSYISFFYLIIRKKLFYQNHNCQCKIEKKKHKFHYWNYWIRLLLIYMENKLSTILFFLFSLWNRCVLFSYMLHSARETYFTQLDSICFQIQTTTGNQIKFLSVSLSVSLCLSLFPEYFFELTEFWFCY